MFLPRLLNSSLTALGQEEHDLLAPVLVMQLLSLAPWSQTGEQGARRHLIQIKHGMPFLDMPPQILSSRKRICPRISYQQCLGLSKIQYLEGKFIK